MIVSDLIAKLEKLDTRLPVYIGTYVASRGDMKLGGIVIDETFINKDCTYGHLSEEESEKSHDGFARRGIVIY